MTLEWVEQEKSRLKSEYREKVLAATTKLNRRLDKLDSIAKTFSQRQPLAGSVAE